MSKKRKIKYPTLKGRVCSAKTIKTYVAIGILLASNTSYADIYIDKDNEEINNDAIVNTNENVYLNYRNSAILNGNIDVSSDNDIQLDVFNDAIINGETLLSSGGNTVVNMFSGGNLKQRLDLKSNDASVSIFEDSKLEDDLNIESKVGTYLATFDEGEVNGDISVKNENFYSSIEVFNNSNVNGDIEFLNEGNSSDFSVFQNSYVDGDVNIESGELGFYLDEGSLVDGDINYSNKSRGNGLTDQFDIPTNSAINGDLNIMTGNNINYYSGTLDLNGDLNIGSVKEGEKNKTISGENFNKLVNLSLDERNNYYLNNDIAGDVSLTAIETEIDGNINAYSSGELELSVINTQVENITASFEEKLYLLLQNTETGNVSVYNTIPSDNNEDYEKNIYIVNSSLMEGLDIRSENLLGESTNMEALIQGNVDMEIGGIRVEKGDIDIETGIEPSKRLLINGDVIAKDDSSIEINNNAQIEIDNANLFMAKIVNKNGSSLNIKDQQLTSNSDLIFENGSLLTLAIENNKNGSFKLSDSKTIRFEDGSSMEVQIIGRLYNNQEFVILDAEKGDLEIKDEQISLNSDGYDTNQITVENKNNKVILYTPVNKRKDYRKDHFIHGMIDNENTLNNIRENGDKDFFIETNISDYSNGHKSYEGESFLIGGDAYDKGKLKITPFFKVSNKEFNDENYKSESNSYGIGLLSKNEIKEDIFYNHYIAYNYIDHKGSSEEYIQGFDYIKGDYKENNFYTSGEIELSKDINGNKISTYTGVSYSVSEIGEYEAGIPAINDFDEVSSRYYKATSVFQGVGLERDMRLRSLPLTIYADTYLRKNVYDNFENNNEKQVRFDLGIKTNNQKGQMNFHLNFNRLKGDGLKGNSVSFKVMKEF